jgi:hypothetical protein
MTTNPATLKADQIVGKVQTGEYCVAQAVGCRGLQLAKWQDGRWTIGARLNTNAARAACKRLKEAHGVHLTYWYAPLAVIEDPDDTPAMMREVRLERPVPL